MTILPVQWLCLASFLAGFIDAIVGGGGLVQLPLALVLLPKLPTSTVVGTLKVPAFIGTAFAAFQYVKKQPRSFLTIAMMLPVAFGAAIGVSFLLTKVSNAMMKPVLLLVLSSVAVFTFFRKEFGTNAGKTDLSIERKLSVSGAICLVLGFYDGFIGPGTGSFLILCFIGLLGKDFLQASAMAKLVNLATNLGSIVLFVSKGSILWEYALPMSLFNALGGLTGARLAIFKRKRFCKGLFLGDRFGHLDEVRI